jgi:hypothetical protein
MDDAQRERLLVDTIALAKRQIGADIDAGLVPADVPDLTSLHDYRDANCYGHLCDDDFPIPAHAAETEPDGSPCCDKPVEDHEPADAAPSLSFANRVDDALDAWIKAGRP